MLPVREEYVLPVLFLFRPIPAEITSGRRGKGNQQAAHCTCQQKLDTKLKKLGIKIEYLYKIQ